MAASLSAIPVDVLQDIGFLLAAFSLPQPPRCLVNLLLTCSRIHDALSVRACPQLYARIFRHTFDFDGSLHTRVPDSVLAVELCHRHRVLWRTRRMDLSSEPDHDELWGAMRLVLENDGRNSRLLATNNFYTFMMSYVLQRLSHAEATNLLPRSNDDTTSLAMWLLCLTLRRQDIVDTPKETRNILSKLLRFPTVHKDFRSVESPVDVSLDMVQDPAAAKGLMTDADRDNLLEKATPAIILIFALNEVVPMAIPSHVPETRAIAKATQRTGPTAEDFRAVNHGRTPLFSETKPPHTTGQNPAAVMSNPVHLALYQSRLSSFLYSTYMDSTYTPAYIYAPGFLSGLWEGSFMISGEPIPTTTLHPLLLGQFRCLKPMQCAITEYLCFSPHSPIPLNYSLDLLERAVKSSCFGYEKYSADSEPCLRNPSDALDVILLGETLPDHEQAWGSFKFAGRIRADGYMIMCREPKGHNSEKPGSWIFEGHLRYGVALVGQWRTNSSTSMHDLGGIFSLRKTAAVW